MYEHGYPPPTKIDLDKISKGEIPYLLKRLEFLELKLNAHWACTGESKDISIVYVANPEENTITIDLCYNVDSTQQKDVDSIYQTALSKLTDEIKRLGWDDWVKIEKKDTSAKIQ